MNFEVAGRRVLIFGHADGDGHLSAVRSKQNVLSDGAASCDLVVEPSLTQSYRFWERGFQDADLGAADLVIGVDIMLNFRNPVRSIDAIAARAVQEPGRQFVLIDHHPVENLPSLPENVALYFTPTVFGCCYGPPDELMIIAAICDRDERPVEDLILPIHRHRALGISRAAVDFGGVSGPGLLGLIESKRWDVVEALADEPREAHRTVRGRRPKSVETSPALSNARDAARIVPTN